MNDQQDDPEDNFNPENYNKYLEDGKPILINIVIEFIKDNKKKGEHKDILMNYIREYEVGAQVHQFLTNYFCSLLNFFYFFLLQNGKM